jgi:molybdate-binding protein/transcriptional regulator with XRE-family HTH domain
MANLPELKNDLRDYRTARGWSQAELAERSGLSRAGVSAIEMGRLVPSAAAALALAAAFGCRVEDLFHLPLPASEAANWAWPPDREQCRYWHAEVGGRTRRYPVEATPLGMIPHDGIYRRPHVEDQRPFDPRQTLVIAGCDPAVRLLEHCLARLCAVRLIVLPRSSMTALTLLKQGLIHAAGVHLARADAPGGNAEAVRSQLGGGFSLLRVARWEEGIASAPARRIMSIRDAMRPNVHWIGREPGSGARLCLDELLGTRHPPRRLASDHRGVAEAIRYGWADAGVCLRLASEEAALNFLSVRYESYDLCFPDSLKGDPRLRALTSAVRSSPYRRVLGDQPGYDTSETGALQRVT